jgi:hypothetical protein
MLFPNLAKACIHMLLIVLVCGTCYAHTDGNRPSTADRHKAYGIECSGCHDNKDKKVFDYKQCLSCHESYKKVAERTKALDRNPHKSHYGNLECNACHHGHRPDENFCSKCHPDHNDPAEQRNSRNKYGAFLVCLMVTGGLFLREIKKERRQSRKTKKKRRRPQRIKKNGKRA